MLSFLQYSVPEMIYTVCAVIPALTFHEVCHGYAAYWLGDDTAKNAGRLTLNPLHHLDPLGVLCMILFRFGWAKPVPVNARNFKNPKRGMAIVAMAGPISNLLFGLLCVFLYYALYLWLGKFAFFTAMADFMSVLAIINVNFAVFNLFPVPPLDGSRVLNLFLPPKYYFGIMKYERYIQLGMMALLYLGVLTVPFNYARSFVIRGMENLVRWILL